MAVTVIKDLGKAVRQQRLAFTIGDLAEGDGKYYRHPDSAQISYPLAVQTALGSLPVGEAVSVAIVGAGPGGIAALYELRQLADANPGRSIQVTIFESDADNFLFKSPPSGDENGIYRRRAGRVSSYTVPDTVYEIGAMRFPSIAGLTWHYAERAFGSTPTVTAFPNPGTVPTEFVFGSQFDRYQGNEWLNTDSPTRIVKDLVIKGFVGFPPGPPIYPIGTRSAGEVIELLAGKDTPVDILKEIQDDWREFIRMHDGTTLEGAVRHILTTYQSDLPSVVGLAGPQLRDWCVELFGRFGFGTGGFKSLFNISLPEMMRLILWDYSNEYTFPAELAPANVDFIAKLYELATTESDNFRVQIEQARVSDAFHYNNPNPGRAGIAFYTSSDGDAQLGAFDYAILALPHDVAAQMVSRLGYSTNIVINPTIGDVGRASTVPGSIRPALLLSTTNGQNAVNARAGTAVSMLHMTRSAKVFATIADVDATTPPVPQFNGAAVSAVISDCGLAASYMVPSTTNPDYRSFLVSYTWDDDSTKLENTFSSWPENDPPAGQSAMYNAMVNRAYRQSPNAANQKWWLYQVLEKVKETDRVSWDWTTYNTAGGFKLDMTGDYYQSSLCFRYHTVARYNNPSLPPTQRLDSRVFLAGCSYSHLGGWLEGAFMSAINAVSGIVASLNQGDLESLNAEARKLFTTLEPVIPMDAPV